MKPTHMWCRSCFGWATVRRVRIAGGIALECRQCGRVIDTEGAS